MLTSHVDQSHSNLLQLQTVEPAIKCQKSCPVQLLEDISFVQFCLLKLSVLPWSLQPFKQREGSLKESPEDPV